MNQLLTLIARAVGDVIRTLFGFGSSLPRPAAYPPQTQRKDFSIEVVRPDDLLVVTLDFYNFRLSPAAGAGPPSLERKGAGHGFIVARLPPQSFGERAYFEATPGKPVPGEGGSESLEAPPVPARIAGRSELVFRITDASFSLDFTLEAILDLLTRSETVVQPTIQQPVGNPPVGWPLRFGGQRSKFTAVEAPYRLVLSPSLEARWQHATRPVTDAAGKRTELWHTRLSAGAKAGAVWSPDYEGAVYGPKPANVPFRMSLNPSYRHRIVRSSADPNLDGAKQVKVRQLMLSSQGAWLSVHGQWDAGLTGLDLVEWEHVMTGGRDQYARVVEEGYLFDCGHRAVIVTITERKVVMATNGEVQEKPVAYLRQIKKIFLREPVKTYSHNQMPHRSIEITTLVTPNLDDPANSEIVPGEADHAFWPKVGGQFFPFHIVVTDWNGEVSEYDKPLAFVIRSTGDAVPTPGSKLARVIEHYNALPESDPRRWSSLGGQKVAYAPPKSKGDTTTTLETFSMTFAACGASGGLPHFLPLMFTASVDVPAARTISGNAAPSIIALDPTFAKGSGGAIGNMGEVFAYLVGKQTPVKFTTDKTGGVVAPDFSISGLSRAYGPVGGDIKKFANGQFLPKDIFKGVKLLGGIELADIISDLINTTPAVAGGKVPQLKTVRKTVNIKGVPKDVMETSYRWKVEGGFLNNIKKFVPVAASELAIDAAVYAPLDNSAPVFKVEGHVKNFSVVLMPATPLVQINFDSVTFRAETDKKVDFAVVFKGFDFLGSLAFVNKLRDILPMDGFDDPPFLNLSQSPPGVNVGFTLSVPTVGIGIFTLQNISFSAGFYLPFLGDEATLRLAFCQRHQPFIVTVMLFGGGGFFGIEIGMGGVRMVEASIEFGASIALNLGVASGMACIMGGVYYQQSGAALTFSAYFRAAGALSVLGFITVSVELYISLNYEKTKETGGKLWGEAKVTVKIKIAFFSVSVSIGIKREFAGSDPKFLDAVKPADWAEYCNAFADYPA